MKELVSVEWLSQNLDKKDLILLDTSLDTTPKFKDLTIPTSRYFDLKGNFSDRRSDLPNTMPSEAQFELECQRLGIGQNSYIIVFDNRGIYSSPRVWWMFKVMGHESVSVLDGGLTEWIKKGLNTEKKIKRTYALGDFRASLNESFVVKYQDIQKNFEESTFTLIDARSEGRFNGTEAEPRKQLKSGHIKGSINIPFQEVLNNNKYKSKEELRMLFQEKCGTDDKLVFSCGSGLTACIVLFASEMAFKKSRYVYDGSWTEWAQKNSLLL
ncbi:MAG: sulfurtransferase [Bacteroidota bacterium]